MDDEEDDVFPQEPHMWGTPFREKCRDMSTQTPGPALIPGTGLLLPCGVGEEPRRLFYGNAGFRLHFPAHFEPVGRQPRDIQGQPGQLEVPPSVEVQIGQKLQRIGDQFHQDQVQLYRRNQRHQQPMWWRLLVDLYARLFDGGDGGRRQRMGLR